MLRFQPLPERTSNIKLGSSFRWNDGVCI